MKGKSKSGVSIIGGADGPTSIFIAGRAQKRPLKVRIRSILYRFKRKRAEKKVCCRRTYSWWVSTICKE